MARPPLRRTLALLLGLATVAGLVLYVGPSEVWRTAAEASLPLFGAAFAVYALFFALRGVRWSMLLDPVASVGPATTSSLSAAGWLISSLIPFKAGDFGRTALVAQEDEASVVEVGGTVAVERALDMMGAAVGASLGLAWIAWSGAAGAPAGVAGWVGLAWILPLAALVGLATADRWLPMDGDGRIAGLARSFQTGLRELLDRRSGLAPIAGLTVLVTAAQAGIFVFLFLAFAPSAPVAPVMAAAPIFLLSFAVSVTPANVGTYEAAFVAVFALAGFGTETLASMAVLVHLSTTLIVIVLGSTGLAWHMATGTRRPDRAPAEVEP